MRVSLNWLRELVQLPESTTTQELSERLTSAGLQIEKVDVVGDVTGPLVVGRVLEFVEEPQKNGKTIRWCQVDVGEEKPRGIVCGAMNFAPNDLVVVSLPGAVLPGGFEIAARKTYGHVSDGMICAADELGVGTDHTGIMILPADIDAKPGDDALALLGIPAEVLEIDVTPDIGCYALSMRGIAREVAQAFALPYTDRYAQTLPDETADGHPVRLETEGCQSFVALRVEGIDPTAKTPLWMSERLIESGIRSISLPVDITNYVMIESGQPLHGYDADKLSGAIVVRQAREGEHLVTLDDADRKLSVEDILITDDSGPIGLAGVMGGQTTELADDTTNVVLEAAHFDPTLIGRTFRRHKLPSEASTRFARGVDPAVGYAAAVRAAELLRDLADGTISEQVTVVGTVPTMSSQQINANLPAKVLGTPVAPERVVEILKASGIDVQADGDQLTLTPPTWRSDLIDPYDYVEEVGRKVGFVNLEGSVPRAAAGKGLTPAQRARRDVIAAVAGAGFVEILSLPFIGDRELDGLGLAADDERRKTVRLANPLADTQPYMRTSLLPGLFDAVARNRSRSQDDLTLFECGLVFPGTSTSAAPMPEVRVRPSEDTIDALFGSLPVQPRYLSAVLTGNWQPASWNRPAIAADWTHAVALAETVAATLGLELSREAAAIAPWHPGRCAALKVGEVVVGHAGELHPKVIKAFELPARACAVELNLDVMIELAPAGGEVSALSSFPLTKEDVALIVDESVSAAQVQAALVEGAGPLLETVRLFDVYTGPQAGEGKKSLAFALGFRAPDRTLNESEAIAARDAAVASAAQKTGAVQRA